MALYNNDPIRKFEVPRVQRWQRRGHSVGVLLARHFRDPKSWQAWHFPPSSRVIVNPRHDYHDKIIIK